jgi:hypothetical protein
MNLKHLSDSELLISSDGSRSKEREGMTEMLHHLKEIDRRKLFSSLGYSSLFKYAVDRYKYSEDQAYRRIAAMRLLKEIPEIEGKINNGTMTLTNISLAQRHFRQERKSTQKPISKAEKLELLELLENKSNREAQKVVLSLSSFLTPPPERVERQSKFLECKRWTVI